MLLLDTKGAKNACNELEISSSDAIVSTKIKQGSAHEIALHA
jgi:hypothetical protein